jgi:cobalamin-dependent methionine synthase I
LKDATFRFGFKDLNISVSEIENFMGYEEGEDRNLVTGLIEEVLKEADQICNIRAQYKTFDNTIFDNENKTVVIKDIIFNVKNIVFAQLKRSGSVALFLCTAGEEIGIRSRKAMNERDFLKGYVYDVVGSEIVEAAADLMQNELNTAVVAEGFKITNRYSPGYCGWSVSEQHKLFKLMPYNYCGIRLTESALMDPVKSVSGIIGIGKDVKLNPYTCKMCDMHDCIYRKLKESKKI